ncbi:galactokinase family protein [Lactobacillus delbrueckii]|uniref:galactokinase family protein n=1 Tax=Lactobacillus delbrueckii TaxID=1584 RepID=UPI00399251E5
MNTAFLKNNFEQIFKQPAADLFFSPGRINIIGEHTDYTGGHVFPARSVWEPMLPTALEQTRRSPFAPAI